MSKNSPKQRYTQLMEWLPTLNIQRKKRVDVDDNASDSITPRFSKADTYNQHRIRH